VRCLFVIRKFALSKTLLLTILSVFILMLLGCANPTTTEGPETVTDIDGNVYHTVQIGNQVWTVENLRVTRYNDGSIIPNLADSAAWVTDTSGAYCYYNNTTNVDSIKKFGALYNWYAIDTKKLAPAGWHVSSDAEWTVLEDYLIANGYNWDGTTTGDKIAKSLAAQTDWYTDSTDGAIGNDLDKNNKSGFSALPGGGRNNNGKFRTIGTDAGWWTTLEEDASYAYWRYLRYDGDYIYRSINHKSFGLSVRCVKD